jgi:hypothetical protein
MTADDSFEVRNSVPDIAAELFESYCKSKGYKYYKMGFDAKENLVEKFWLYPASIRHLPDYSLVADDKVRFIQVKGTSKLKIEDLIEYSKFEDTLDPTRQSLHIAFCFKGYKPITLSMSTVKQHMLGRYIQCFDNDKKLYIDLAIKEKYQSHKLLYTN